MRVSIDCLSLSVVIITLNEEANLARTLASVAWADEILETYRKGQGKDVK